MKYSFLTAIGVWFGLFVLIPGSAVVAQIDDTTVTFYSVVPFAQDEFGFSLSVLSDSSIWFTTNKGVFHFDGKESEKKLDRSLFTHSQLEILLVDAVDDRDVWVLGHDAKNWQKTVYHFNGEQWATVAFPQVTEDPEDDLVVFQLKMFRSANRTLGYAVGQDGIVYFYDGKHWKLLSLFTIQTLRGLHINNEHDVWIGGKGGTIYHYDGTSWRRSPVQDSSQYIVGFSAVSAHDGWAVTATGILHYDGSVWHTVPSPVNGAHNGIVTTSPSEAWIFCQDGTLLRSVNGGSWNAFKHILTTGMRSSIGVSLPRGKPNLYLLGSNGIWLSYWGKLPFFTDISATSNLHLYGGMMHAVDLDQNGTQDILTVSSMPFPDRLYSNRGDGFFTEMTEKLHPINDPAGNVASIADIDNDHRPDIFLTRHPRSDVWYKNHGGWKFEQMPSAVPLTESSDRSKAVFTDIDNDGDLDFLFLDPKQADRNPALTLYLNDGVGHFTKSSTIGRPLILGGLVFSFFVADLDNNGHPDIFKYNTGDWCELYLNNGDGSFRDASHSSGADGQEVLRQYPSITWACPIDINHDGALDIFLVGRNEGKSVFLLNDGHGLFRQGNSMSFDPGGENPTGAFVDIDCDGQQDLFLLDRFYHNEHGTLSEDHTVGLRKAGSTTFADIDNDGDADLLMQAIHENSRIYVYRNEFNPTNVVTVNLHGIRSNSFAIGAHLSLWERTENGGKTLAEYQEAFTPTPMTFSLHPGKSYDLEVIFPSGMRVTRSGVTPGVLEVEEFSFPASIGWDFIYSLNRSFHYAQIPFEAIKFLVVIGILIICVRISSTFKVKKYITHPAFIIGIVCIYFLSLHATIREGSAASNIIPISLVVLLSGGTLIVLRFLIARRDAQFISHFKLLEHIGEGGMGKVYKAMDIHTKQTVAVKVLNAELMNDPENRKRLAAEGQLLSSFSHPHIVKVFEVGETVERGFIAMEYLAGGTLKEYLSKFFPLPLTEVKRIVLQVSRGLEEIHRHGIIHRDIKTGNIMLDEQQNVRIMDFGLSKSPLVTTMTTLGTIIGTLGYIAPEQVTNMNVDHRVDIFSYGVVLYELLTNTLPFNGENEIAVIHAIFNTVPPAPSSIQQGVPAELDKIIAQCIAKNPHERFASIADVRVALDRDFW